MNKRLWIVCVAAVAVALLAGCSTVDPERIRSQMGNKAIVVLVNVPNELPLSWVGTTPLNNQSAVHSNPDWTIRHWIEERAVTALRQSGRSARALVLLPGAQVNLTQLIDVSNEVVLVISSGYGPDKVFDRIPYVRGVGLRQHTWFGLEAASATYVRLNAQLLNPSHREETNFISSESFQRLPFVALEKGPVMHARVEGAVRDVVRVQIDAVMLDLIGKLGLIEGPFDSKSPHMPSAASGPRG